MVKCKIFSSHKNVKSISSSCCQSHIKCHLFNLLRSAALVFKHAAPCVKMNVPTGGRRQRRHSDTSSHHSVMLLVELNNFNIDLLNVHNFQRQSILAFSHFKIYKDININTFSLSNHPENLNQWQWQS